MRTAARRRIHTLLLTATLALVALVATQASNAATGGCAARSTAQVFSRFGDTNDYFLLQGGSFEATDGWSLGSGQIVDRNEPFYLAGASDTRSLRLQPGSTVASPWVCIGKAEPALRFVARPSTGGNYTSLNVTITLRGATGSQASVYLGQLSAGDVSSWQPSPIYSYAAWLNQPWLYAGGDTVQAQIVFTVGGSGGTWSLDDVFVDPFKGI